MRARRPLLAALAFGLVLAAGPASAEPPETEQGPDRDDAIFGADDDDEDEGDEGEPAADGERPDEDAIFGDPDDDEDEQEEGLLQAALDMAARLDEQNDLLQIGGQLWLRLDWMLDAERGPSEWPLRSPNLLDLYLDVRPNDRIRAYAQGRLTHDFSVGEDSVDPFTGEPRPATRVFLDQLWIKLDIARHVFITAGRQPLRWGVGRIWNPTDFLNARFRDPLAVFDDRLGVSLIKVHVPIEALDWNLYAIADIEGVDAVDDIGGAVRAEMLFGNTELTVSVAGRKDQPLRLGASLSTSVWLFDVRAELALLHDVRTLYYKGDFDLETGTFPTAEDRSDEWFARAVAGAEIGIGYGDDDALYIGAEYAYNGLGYDDADLYPWLLFQGAYEPFYAGFHYVGAYVYLPAPGRFDDGSFNLTALGNLSDLSFITRLDFRVRVLTYLDVNAYAAVHFGERGELRFGADVPALPGVEGLENGLSIPPPLLDLGLGLRVRL